MQQYYVDKIEEQLKKKLPGKASQNKMASSIRIQHEIEMLKIKVPKHSSILLLLYPNDNNLFTVLIQRNAYEGVHSNQVSFPGGQKEKNDTNYLTTALREAEEEIGIDASKIKILGELTDLYVPPSNFIIHPFVGYCEKTPIFTPQKNEVKEILKVPIADLQNRKNIKNKIMEWEIGGFYETKYYDICNKVVWGATAMIISEFMDVIKK